MSNQLGQQEFLFLRERYPFVKQFFLLFGELDHISFAEELRESQAKPLANGIESRNAGHGIPFEQIRDSGLR